MWTRWATATHSFGEGTPACTAGVSAASAFTSLIGPVLLFTLDFVWRFVTDPISHACWSGLAGYFIVLAATRQHRWYRVR